MGNGGVRAGRLLAHIHEPELHASAPSRQTQGVGHQAHETENPKQSPTRQHCIELHSCRSTTAQFPPSPCPTAHRVCRRRLCRRAAAAARRLDGRRPGPRRHRDIRCMFLTSFCFVLPPSLHSIIARSPLPRRASESRHRVPAPRFVAYTLLCCSFAL